MTTLVRKLTHIFEKEEEKVVTKSQPYSNPYIVGVGLGLVLLAAYVIGRGLGASGAMTTLVSVGVDKVSPEHAKNNEFFSEYLGDGITNPFKDWLVFEVIGVIAGGFISGSLAGRVRKELKRSTCISN
jgi:hypothetical protein